jgi:tetratricopeptide (TPR) repeat protein
MKDMTTKSDAKRSDEVTTSVLLPEPVFFGSRDKLAFVVATLVTLALYLYTVAPSVTLEDSGEFVAAANSLGVPHPPGYPIWTILAWVFKTVIPFGNVAWRVNVMSTVFGAVACGLAALIVSKAGHVMGHRVGILQKVGNERLVDWLVLGGAVASGVILAGTPVLWSQAVIAEVYSLNAFFLMLTLTLLYRWSFEPERRSYLYWAALVWGVSLTNHQTLVLLLWAFPFYVWLVDREVGRATAVPILAASIAILLWMNIRTQERMVEQLQVALQATQPLGPIDALRHLFHPSVREPLFPLFCQTVTILVLGVWMYWLVMRGQWVLRGVMPALIQYGMVILGMALYLYMPIASATNPPMNWGYTRTVDGFIHHFTRGQYDKIKTDRSLAKWWDQLAMFLGDVSEQFNPVFAVLALTPLVFLPWLDRRSRDWVLFLVAGYVLLTIGFLFLSNPVIEKQKQFTDRVFFLPGHCIWALLIGFALILLGGLLAGMRELQPAAWGMCGLFFLLPFWWMAGFCMPQGPVRDYFLSRWANNEQRDHDYGYKFGYLMFKPGGGYPEMERDAVLYGGTDPGRFVPTYMIMVESQVSPRSKTRMEKYPDSGTFDRRDVYIITQNALADGTYMRYIRDHYWDHRPDARDPVTLASYPFWQRWLFKMGWSMMGRKEAYPEETIWLPNDGEVGSAFRLYYEDRQSRGGGGYETSGNKISVHGVAEVMEINGIIARQIFEKNKHKHEFYVEESYVIPWMYPYLEPYGIIMKINREPLRGLTAETVARDREYWAGLTDELMSDEKFLRDDVARKTFSKLRAAIAGVYAHWEMWDEAEYAFRQAVDLGPDSPEANFRLTQLYMRMERFDEAIAIMEAYQRNDQQNDKIHDMIGFIRELRRATQSVNEMAARHAANPDDLALIEELMKGYASLHRFKEIDKLMDTVTARVDLSADNFWILIQNCARIQRHEKVFELVIRFTERFPTDSRGWKELTRWRLHKRDSPGALAAMKQYLKLAPQDALGWYQLGLIYAARLECEEALNALSTAVAADPQLNGRARQDAGWNTCSGHPRFKELITQ